MRSLHIISLLLLLSPCSIAQRTFDVTIGDSTYHMKKYWMVLYEAGNGPALDSVTTATLQAAHLAHQDEQAKRGIIALAGPFDRNDMGWRGMLIYDCDTEEEVRGYLERDPFVKVRRLQYRIAPWWGSVGTRLP
ncbi:MAG: hypothetical protein KA817_05815 [Flavobacteriales bacterium]|nr:hypothetical protein [Flavobacteriales bacterium]